MERLYPSYIIPALPLKGWTLPQSLAYPLTASLTQSEKSVNDRARDLQLFINSLVQHTALRQTYEVETFFRASSRGFKVFKELYSGSRAGSLEEINGQASGVGGDAGGGDIRK